MKEDHRLPKPPVRSPYRGYYSNETVELPSQTPPVSEFESQLKGIIDQNGDEIEFSERILHKFIGGYWITDRGVPLIDPNADLSALKKLCTAINYTFKKKIISRLSGILPVFE